METAAIYEFLRTLGPTAKVLNVSSVNGAEGIKVPAPGVTFQITPDYLLAKGVVEPAAQYVVALSRIVALQFANTNELQIWIH